MSEETRLVLQAIIGILVAVVVAFVTSWFNRNYFREQLGEQRYVEVYLDKILDLWKEVLDIYHETANLIGEMHYEAEQRQKKGLPKTRIDSDLARIYEKRLPPLSIKVIALEKYYLILRPAAVNTLQEMERMLTVTLRRPGEHDFAELSRVLEELGRCSNDLVQQLRSDASDLASREITVSEILAERVDITPPYIAQALSPVQDPITNRPA